jgi:hypothetical protein
MKTHHALKRRKTMTTEATETSSTTIRILKEDTCPSSSGKSELSYQVGCNKKDELFLRVIENTGNGYFNQHWVALDKALSVIKDSKHPITGHTLQPLYNRQSINTSYFLVAALYNEGLLTREKRRYLLGDTKDFMTKMKTLVAEKTKPPVPPAKSTKAKVPRTKKATAA